MALELRQSLKLSQQLLMTPQLQQAIKLLALSRIELEQFVTQQLMENPILEEAPSPSEAQVEGSSEGDASGDDLLGSEMREAQLIVDPAPDGNDSPEIDWESLSRLQESAQPGSMKSRSEEAPNYENMVSTRVSLTDYLLQQVSELEFSPAERKVAANLIGNLSDKGFLDLDLPAYAESEGFDLEFVEGILDTLQRLNPPGVFARDLQECLLIQLRAHGLRNGVVEKIIADHLSALESKNYPLIAREMKISKEEVIANIALIGQLDPYPAREFGDSPAHYVVPDIYVLKMGDRWVVRMNEEGLPLLRVNSLYRDMALAKAQGQEKAYLQEKLKSAHWLLKSIQQRQRTIFRVTECIVERQHDFLEQGVRFLRPMILKDVADDIGMHESTVSRVTSQKYVHTPRGTFELKYFFNSSIATPSGGDLASESVKAMIKEVIAAEDPQKPHSDQKLVTLLEEKGARLARRTVAKYREQLGILPSSKRKEY